MAKRKESQTKRSVELKVHAELEEKIFYSGSSRQSRPRHYERSRRRASCGQGSDCRTGKDGRPRRSLGSQVQVLSENMEHHIKEEERDMLPKARKLDLDFDALGRTMLRCAGRCWRMDFPWSAKRRWWRPAKGKAIPQRRMRHLSPNPGSRPTNRLSGCHENMGRCWRVARKNPFAVPGLTDLPKSVIREMTRLAIDPRRRQSGAGISRISRRPSI